MLRRDLFLTRTVRSDEYHPELENTEGNVDMDIVKENEARRTMYVRQGRQKQGDSLGKSEIANELRFSVTDELNRRIETEINC